ncbi:MAG TPA: GGDEF domain-containing protein [Gaiellaceae bacterium]|nr:GGDEF domain-containing protein [Gaiellaceae bacterium]
MLYLGFYPLMLVGLLSLPVAKGNRARNVRLAVDLAVVTIASSAAVIYVVLGPTVVANSGSPVQVGFSIAYPVGDMVLLVGLASLLLRGSAPSAQWALRLLAAGLLLFVVGDLVYGYITLHSSYQSGDPIDTTWMVALALMAVAGTTQRAVDRPERIDAIRERVGWLPPSAVAFGFGILVFSDRRVAVFPGLVMVVIAIVLAGLVLARQMLVQRDLLAAQGQLHHQAFHDALTGLPNRLLLLDRAEQLLSRARRDGGWVPVLFLDIDGFKRVNDSFGHAAGDTLLKTVALRLTSVVRECDTVARLGGDEFVILLDPTAPMVGPELVAERLLVAVREPIPLNGADQTTLTISASIGITNGPHTTADELLHDADLALYRAKERGKDCYVVFEQGLGAIAEDLWPVAHVG